MARQARQKCEAGIYHVMLRGVNRQPIFEDDEDSARFLSTLDRFKKECRCPVLAYCLMGNHVHLLIKENDTPLQVFFKKAGVSYVYYFNQKYDRVGPLFQDRYRSEPIQDDAQLLQTLRYIHRNPVKAGLCARPEEYRLSSYREYVTGEDGLADRGFILSMVSREELIRSTNEYVEDTTGEPDAQRKKLSDKAALALMKELCGKTPIGELQTLKKPERDRLLVRMKESGISLTQINRLTGISKSIISRAGK